MDRNVIAGARPQNLPEIFSFWGADLRMYSTLSGVEASQTIYLMSAFARKV